MTLMRYRQLGSSPEDERLGRFVPDDWEHVEKYPLRAVADAAIESVERSLELPRWHWSHDQGQEGSCVGHATAMERAITNTAQNKLVKLVTPGRRYDPIFLWNKAKEIDEWEETNPGDDNGTSVRAAYDILRTLGARVIRSNGIHTPPGAGIPVVTDQRNTANLTEGISRNRWARTVDEMRLAIAFGNPVTIGINWYQNFDTPQPKKGRFGRQEFWIGEGNLGRLRGGHAVCVFGASDRRQAFAVKNSWGRKYPLVWLTYTTMDKMLHQYGEATLQTDM